MKTQAPTHAITRPPQGVLALHTTEALKDLSADTLVVGAGPAGCAAAIALAQAGRDVLLIDQHTFPRDKTCGDGLIPDAMKALAQLGVLDQVRQLATPVKGVVCHGPAGGHLTIPGDLAVLPRKDLDACLFERSRQAGARTLTGVRFVEPHTDRHGRVCGARVSIDGQEITIDANWTILATGANVSALQASRHCSRSRPSAMALRAYVYHPGFVDDSQRPIEHLHISWHKSYAPGYGWVFPCPNGIFNVGVGLYGMHQTDWRTRMTQRMGLRQAKPAKANLSALFQQFTDANPMVKRLIETGTIMGGIKGAPLRCSLEGAKPATPGMLITGEAMGSTYALTGEGIGKAMETGILSAQALLGSPSDAAVIQTYQQSLKELQPKFAIYQQANKINRAPWLIDLAIARGNRSPRLVQRMSRVLEEKANPALLFTWRGAWKFLTE